MNTEPSLAQEQTIDYLALAQSQMGDWLDVDSFAPSEPAAVLTLIDIAQSLRRIADVMAKNRNKERNR